MNEQHIPHSELVASADGELTEQREAEIRKHLAACWTCRTQMKQIEDTISDFVRAHQASTPIASAEGPRALLRAKMAAVPPPAVDWRDRFADFMLSGNRLAYLGGSMAAITAVLFVIGVVEVSHQQFRLRPDPKLTPGQVLAEDRAAVCKQTPSHFALPHDVGRLVFDLYGIDKPGKRGYELDYLIPPELGGADDPKNLWPQPYLSEWNAHLKDALEDQLHSMVCRDEITLAAAQHELATDWIAAYKKYFRTNGPMQRHREFTKDSPWEP